MAESVADDTMPPAPSAVSPAARSQLEAIRDEWLQPLIDQLREAERTIGRLESERDALQAELAAARESQVTLQDRAAGTQRSDQPEVAPTGVIDRLWRLLGR